MRGIGAFPIRASTLMWGTLQAIAALEWASNGGNTLGLRGAGAFPVRVVALNGSGVLKVKCV